MPENDDLATTDVDFVSAVENPDLLRAAEAMVSSTQPPTLPDPLDGPVNLPVGFRRPKESGGFEDVRTAWVRELNGEDEERIARAKMRDEANAFVNAVLEAGVERLGDTRPTKDDFNSMAMGDTDYLMLEIARVTYGDTLEYTQFGCPWCEKQFDFSLSLSEDIPVRRLDKIDDADFDIPLRNDRVAHASLPTYEVANLVSKVETPAEANTILVAYSISEIRGPKGSVEINGDLAAAKRLGVRDRQEIVEALGKRMPGPQYNGVKFEHEPGCGKEIRLTVTMADLFRGL